MNPPKIGYNLMSVSGRIQHCRTSVLTNIIYVLHIIASKLQNKPIGNLINNIAGWIVRETVVSSISYIGKNYYIFERNMQGLFRMYPAM